MNGALRQGRRMGQCGQACAGRVQPPSPCLSTSSPSSHFPAHSAALRAFGEAIKDLPPDLTAESLR